MHKYADERAIQELITGLKQNCYTANSNVLTSNIGLTPNSTFKIFFTTDILGSNDSTGLSILYNNNNYPVKVKKQSSLVSVKAHDVDGQGTYVYIQENTVLDIFFDGTDFIITGNPVLYKSESFTAYADGTTLTISTTDLLSGVILPQGSIYIVREA